MRDAAYINSLTEEIIACAYAVGNALGSGFLEKVYENAMAHELGKTGLTFVKQQPIKVHYDGILVGDFFADLVVDDEVIVELKSVKSMDDSHFAQCLNYLKATGKRIALLINFGGSRVQVKRIVNNL